MSKESAVFILGFIIAVTPFAGIPDDWKRLVFIGAGTLVLVLGYQLRRAAFLRSIETAHGERQSDVFVESSTPEDASDFLTETDERFGV